MPIKNKKFIRLPIQAQFHYFTANYLPQKILSNFQRRKLPEAESDPGRSGLHRIETLIAS
jgi:hypothetical protein